MRTRVESHTSIWQWNREPSSLTQVCIVTDSTVAPAFEQALSTRMGNSPQVAWMHVPDPAAAHDKWLTSREKDPAQACGPDNAIRQAIDPLPRDSRLLLCSENLAGLEWLGGVLGQQVLFAHYRPDENHETQAGSVVSIVEDVLRAALTEKWGDSY
jgi:hypothetical protein